VLIPLGLALVGPVSSTIGRHETLWLSLAIMLASWAAILALPSVRAIRRTDAGAVAEPPPTLSTMSA